MKRITILALMALLSAAELGCGGSAIGDLRSITLTFVQPANSQNFSPNLAGLGSTLQMQAIGNYSTGATQDITPKVTFTATAFGTDDGGAILPNPITTTCSAPTCGVVSISTTGLITAVQPAACTWIDTNSGGTTPSWATSGGYQITASFHGITSQPAFVSVASAAGVTDPTGQCGP